MMIITLASSYYASHFFVSPDLASFCYASLFDHVHPLLIIFHITLPDQKRRKKAQVPIFVQVLHLGRAVPQPLRCHFTKHIRAIICHRVPHHDFFTNFLLIYSSVSLAFTFTSLVMFLIMFVNFHNGQVFIVRIIFHHFHPFLIINHITLQDQTRRKKAQVPIFVQVLQLGKLRPQPRRCFLQSTFAQVSVIMFLTIIFMSFLFVYSSFSPFPGCHQFS